MRNPGRWGERRGRRRDEKQDRGRRRRKEGDKVADTLNREVSVCAI